MYIHIYIHPSRQVVYKKICIKECLIDAYWFCLLLYVVVRVVICMLFNCFWLFSASLSHLRIASNAPEIGPLYFPENDLRRLLNYSKYQIEGPPDKTPRKKQRKMTKREMKILAPDLYNEIKKIEDDPELQAIKKMERDIKNQILKELEN